MRLGRLGRKCAAANHPEDLRHLLAGPANPSTAESLFSPCPSKMSMAIYTILAVLLTIGFGWWWSWLKSSPSLSPTPTGNQPPPKGGWTFRVRGVPRDWDRVSLETFLAEQDCAGPAVRSLATEIDGLSQTATISFRNIPPRLQTAAQTKRPLRITLPAPPNQPTALQSITLDNGFLGITTLYAPSLQDRKAE